MLQSRCLCIPANPPYLSKSQILEGSEVRFASSASQHDCESSEARVRCGKPLRSAASAALVRPRFCPKPPAVATMRDRSLGSRLRTVSTRQAMYV